MKTKRKETEVLQVSWRKLEKFLNKCYCGQGKEKE